ncbi:MAG: hypothetical protein K1W21_11045 [Oscillospiraceae bacterium]
MAKKNLPLGVLTIFKQALLKPVQIVEIFSFHPVSGAPAPHSGDISKT